MQRFASLVTAFAFTLIGRALAADTPAPGYSLTSSANPVFGSVTCTLPGGDFVTFDGQHVDRWTAAGALVMHLATLPAPDFASFVEAAPGGATVVIGVTGANHDLWTVATDGSGFAPLAQVAFNYDAEFDASGRLLVSAATGGFGTGNDIVRVTLPAGSVTQLGHVDGSSGPIALDWAGNLLYATNDPGFPAPPGSTDVLMWSASQLANAPGVQLSNANAAVVATGFDGGASLAVDRVARHVYLADTSFTNNTYRIRRVGASQASSPIVVDAVNYLANLDFENLGGPASFDSYQPANGLRLHYTTTDFSSVSDRATVVPKRPVMTLSGPGTTGVGAVTLTITGGVPNGVAYLVFCKQAHLFPSELPLPFAGFLFHTKLDPTKTRRLAFYLPSNASGTSQFVLFNPGGLQGLYAYQYLVGTPAGVFIGSSNSVQF